jgi:hypothetical protein
VSCKDVAKKTVKSYHAYVLKYTELHICLCNMDEYEYILSHTQFYSGRRFGITK